MHERLWLAWAMPPFTNAFKRRIGLGRPAGFTTEKV
jgi:hypothetical protein